MPVRSSPTPHTRVHRLTCASQVDHTHCPGEASFAGTFWVQTGGEGGELAGADDRLAAGGSGGGGALRFVDPRPAARWHALPGLFGPSELVLSPAAGGLAIFPCWLQHSVTSHRPVSGRDGARGGRRARISVSFNLMLHQLSDVGQPTMLLLPPSHSTARLEALAGAVPTMQPPAEWSEHFSTPILRQTPDAKTTAAITTALAAAVARVPSAAVGGSTTTMTCSATAAAGEAMEAGGCRAALSLPDELDFRLRRLVVRYVQAATAAVAGDHLPSGAGTRRSGAPDPAPTAVWAREISVEAWAHSLAPDVGTLSHVMSGADIGVLLVLQPPSALRRDGGEDAVAEVWNQPCPLGLSVSQRCVLVRCAIVCLAWTMYVRTHVYPVWAGRRQMPSRILRPQRTTGPRYSGAATTGNGLVNRLRGSAHTPSRRPADRSTPPRWQSTRHIVGLASFVRHIRRLVASHFGFTLSAFPASPPPCVGPREHRLPVWRHATIVK